MSEKIDNLEEKADDAATLLLDLADHDLADTKLQRAVELGYLQAYYYLVTLVKPTHFAVWLNDELYLNSLKI